MNAKNLLLFWILVLGLLTSLYSNSLGSVLLSFFFVSFLLPVILGTSLVFNKVLVPRFLLMGRYVRFGLYLFYLIVISLYLELLVIILAFVILADYRIENLGEMAGDVYFLTALLFLIVLISGFIEIVIGFKSKSTSLEKLEKQRGKELRNYLLIKVNRKNMRVDLEDLKYIESLGDYIKVYTLKGEYRTREKISSFEEILPEYFIRIHRSFIVNGAFVDTFSKEEITIGDIELPIGRKYKSSASEGLKATSDNTTRR